MQTANIVFTPKNKLQRRSAGYVQAVAGARASMRAYFAKYPQPRVDNGTCPWVLTGNYARCGEIAQQFAAPAWDVVWDANPGARED